MFCLAVLGTNLGFLHGSQRLYYCDSALSRWDELKGRGLGSYCYLRIHKTVSNCIKSCNWYKDNQQTDRLWYGNQKRTCEFLVYGKCGSNEQWGDEVSSYGAYTLRHHKLPFMNNITKLLMALRRPRAGEVAQW